MMLSHEYHEGATKQSFGLLDIELNVPSGHPQLSWGYEANTFLESLFTCATHKQADKSKKKKR